MVNLGTMTSSAASKGSLLPAYLEAGGSVISSAAGVLSAERQMKFQKNMSNTAHQREVRDLRAAGINPILTAGGSGASQPVGASVTPENPLRGLTQSMMQRRLQRYQIDNMSAENAKLLKEASKIDADARLSSALADKAEIDTGLAKENMNLTLKQLITEGLRQKGVSLENLAKEYDNIVNEAKSNLYKGPGRYIMPLIDKANESVGNIAPFRGMVGQKNIDQREIVNETVRDRFGKIQQTKQKTSAKSQPRRKRR